MSKRKFDYPVLVEGQQVRLLKDIMRRPLQVVINGGSGYGDPYVYIPVGAVGTVRKIVVGDMYSVSFDEPPTTIALYISALEVVEVGA